MILDDDQTLHLIWIKSGSWPWITEYARSEDGGTTWTEPGTFDFPGYSLHKHAVSMDDAGNLNAGWGDSGVFFSRSTDGGDTWSTPTVVCDTNTIKAGKGPNRVTTATDPSGNISIAWSMNYTLTLDEIYFSRSTDGGTTWSDPINVSSAAGRSEWPVLEVDAAGYLYVAWEDNQTGTYHIHFTSSHP